MLSSNECIIIALQVSNESVISHFMFPVERKLGPKYQRIISSSFLARAMSKSYFAAYFFNGLMFDPVSRKCC